MEEKLDEQLLILYASQTGNAMDAAERLGREAERRGCPSVSVLSIDEFQLFVAKKLDKRLSDLGAMAIIERGLGDDQHPSGYEGALDPWMSALWSMLYLKNHKLLPNGSEFVAPDATLIDQPRVRIIYHDGEEGVPPLSTSADLKYLEAQIEMARSMTPGKFSGKNRPDCFLKMSIDYEVGDVLEVLPGQNPAAVDAFIQRCNLNPESYITVMSYFAIAEHEKERLQYFASPEGRDDLYKYNQKERRTVLEVLEDFPSVQMPFEWLVQLVPPLKTRAFSISSSHSAHPNQVHLTVSVVSWTTPYKRTRMVFAHHGLPVLILNKESLYQHGLIKVLFLPHRHHFLLFSSDLELDAPLSMDSWRKEHCRVKKSQPPLSFSSSAVETKKTIFYTKIFGFHIQKGMEYFRRQGWRILCGLFKGPAKKVYVQHKMRENSEKIWSLLNQGASVYVAGSANKMPSDVLSAFEEIVSKESGVPNEAALRWIRTLEKAGKYHVEAWS
ncbi:hypothetical protein DH2020_037788 [Rehmannia glutinosa]|uniref:Sulfite reductase [NADPH] flavoprotein alpha-component-like FAD-binding domain-containing protein n=1 Tax=Rehmannia glutinosa TaxID=99300 RepID=A0ABR0V2G4_REHGL